MNSKAVNVVLVLVTLYAVCSTEEHPKRAPSGFTGVRGKKSVPDPVYSDGSRNTAENAITSDDFKGLVSDVGDGGTIDKRAPSGFMGMRGKKPYPLWEGTYPEEVYKRAPSGFMGMRGKKDLEFANYGDDYIKRAPSGFMGMRGKKDYDYPLTQDDFYPAKRAPMGFVGMRGKKDYDDLLGDKRAPSGFFGMRGKKQPRQSGFFGMRGKKYPYEFRGKFVGVRGKKLADDIAGPDYENDLNLQTMGQDLDLNQLMLLLTEADNDVWNVPNQGGRYSQN